MVINIEAKHLSLINVYPLTLTIQCGTVDWISRGILVASYAM